MMFKEDEYWWDPENAAVSTRRRRSTGSFSHTDIHESETDQVAVKESEPVKVKKTAEPAKVNESPYSRKMTDEDALVF